MSFDKQFGIFYFSLSQHQREITEEGVCLCSGSFLLHANLTI